MAKKQMTFRLEEKQFGFIDKMLNQLGTKLTKTEIVQAGLEILKNYLYDAVYEVDLQMMNESDSDFALRCKSTKQHALNILILDGGILLDDKEQNQADKKQS